jgi:hypothetical protein
VFEPLLAAQRRAGIPASSYILGFLGMAAMGEGQPALAGAYYHEALVNGRANGDLANMAFTIERIAGHAAARKQFERAGRLVGVAAALRRSVAAPSGVPQGELLEREIAPARQALGGAGFAAAVAAGEALPLEAGVAAALSMDDTPSP